MKIIVKKEAVELVISLFILVLVFIGIAFYEVPKLIREKLWRELWTFSILLLIGFVLSVLQIMGIKVPLPKLPQ